MSIANLTATVAAQFKLNDEQRETVELLLECDAERRKRYSDFVSMAQGVPSMVAQLRANLVADLVSAGCQAESVPVAKPADKPKATRKRTTKAAQTALPAPAVKPLPAPPVKQRKPVALCAAPSFTTSVAWYGSAPPAGSKVWYEDSTDWEDYVAASNLPAPPAKVPAKETSVTVSDKDIPDSPCNPRYKMPWVQGASLYAETGKVYVRFGSGRRSVSLLAEEFMATLDRADELRSLVATLEARVG